MICTAYILQHIKALEPNSNITWFIRDEINKKALEGMKHLDAAVFLTLSKLLTLRLSLYFKTRRALKGFGAFDIVLALQRAGLSNVLVYLITRGGKLFGAKKAKSLALSEAFAILARGIVLLAQPFTTRSYPLLPWLA